MENHHHGYLRFAYVNTDVSEKSIWRAYLIALCISLYIDNPWFSESSPHSPEPCLLTDHNFMNNF